MNAETTDPTAGERIKAGRIKHGVGASDYLPGNVQHLVSPIVGTLRLRQRDGETVPDLGWIIDRLSLVLDLARQEDARSHAPAEPDAGDVEALANTALSVWSNTCNAHCSEEDRAHAPECLLAAGLHRALAARIGGAS